MDTLIYSTTLDVITCGECRIPFAIPSNLNREAIDNHSTRFWCPNGHHIGYRGPDKAAKLQAELDKVKAARTRQQAVNDRLRMERDAVERSNRALRGHLTRYHKRVANGVCPVAGCKRHFPNVQDHVATVHPEWLAEHPEVFEP